MDLSIIMPVYNVELYIKKSVESIINQKKNTVEFELLLVNDGSTDNSIELANKLLKKSSVNYKVIDQENSGVSKARNSGILQAVGKHVFFLDSDDYVSNDFLEKISLELDRKKDIIFWQFNSVDSKGKDINKYTDKYNNTSMIFSNGMKVLEEILIEKKHLIWTGSAVYSRKLLLENKIFYNEKYINGEDQEFTFNALIFASKVKFVADTLSFYLIRENSISTTFQIRKFESVLALNNIRIQLYTMEGINKELLNAIDSYIAGNFLFVYKTGLKIHKINYMISILDTLDDYYPNIKKLFYDLPLNTQNKPKVNNIEITLARKSFFYYSIYYKMMRKLKILTIK